MEDVNTDELCHSLSSLSAYSFGLFSILCYKFLPADYLEDVDTDKLAELEAELDRLEKELDQANINAELETLKEQNEKIKCWRDKYEADLSQFRKDVENIAAINDSLPDDCFKSIDIGSRLDG